MFSKLIATIETELTPTRDYLCRFSRPRCDSDWFDFSKCYDIDGCNRYAKGQWATNLKD